MTQFRKFTPLFVIPTLLFGAPGDVITWTGASSSDLTDSDNWSPFNTPTNGTEADFDNTASNFTPTVSSTTASNLFQVDLVKIDTNLPSPPTYTFHVDDPDTFFQVTGSYFNPSGVEVTNRNRISGIFPEAPIQNFYIDNGGFMEFERTTIADIGYSISEYGLPPFIVYNLGAGGSAGFMGFTDSSQAGNAGFNLHNGSNILFDVQSIGSIGQFNLDSGSSLVYSGLSNASGSIIKAIDSAVAFTDGANAFIADITLDHSTLDFSLAADVHESTINANNGSIVTMQGSTKTVANAVINLTDSSLTYKETADGGNTTITADHSDIHFIDSSSVDIATINLTNNSTLEFIDNADATLANISANASQVTFGLPNNSAVFPNSARATLTMDNASTATFNNNASLSGINIRDAASTLNLNNFLPTPMTINALTVINNGHLHINPDANAGVGPIVLTDAFNSYPFATVHRGVLIGNSLNIVGTISNFSTIVFEQTISQSLLGSISGPGNVVIQGGGTLIIEDEAGIEASLVQVLGDDTVLTIEDNSLHTPILALGDGSSVNFEVTDLNTVTFNGMITDNGFGDAGSVDINEFEGSGTLILSNPANNYTGGTTLYGGTLQIDNAVGVPGLINVKFDHTRVVFNQQIDGTYSGTLDGYASGSKIGSAKLTFPANSINTLRSMIVSEGEFHLDGTIISPLVRVNNGGILSGTGTVTGELEVFGTLAPGNSQSNLTVIGNLELEPSSTYHVVVDGAGNSTHVNVTGPADDPDDGGFITLEGGTVVADVEGSFDPRKRYTILSATSSLTGRFGSSIFNDPFYRAIVTYDNLHAYLQVQSAFLTIGARTFNERQVAKQLAQIHSTNSHINDFLLALLDLPTNKALHALDQMSAQQYSHIFLAAAGVNQRFIRRLYNPIREINSPLKNCCGNVCCEEICGDSSPTWQTWADASFDRSFVDGNRNTSGFKGSGYELSLGVQTTLENSWTLGLAGTYEDDHLDFNIGGRSRNQTGLGALYGLYHPGAFYLLGDLILGYSSQNLRRPIDVSPFHLTKKGRPQLFQGSVYGEAGMSFCRSCIGIQPFIGVEVDFFDLRKFHEKANPHFLNVDVKNQNETYANSRLGVHLTASPIDAFLASFDLAWQCRLSSLKNHFHERFVGFGDPFYIKGVPLQRNSVDATFNLAYDIADGWEFYAEAAGQWWRDSSFYDLLAGINITW